MLTSDLLRVRTKKGAVLPQYLDPDAPAALERATQLTSIFREHVGEPRKVIDDAVDEAVGFGTDFVVWRGLAKLLRDRSSFETVAACDPVDARRAVFELATSLGPVSSDAKRTEIIEAAARRLEVSAEQLDQALYADLEARQRLIEHRPLTPISLLHRYNLALAQAVLYKATHMVVELERPTSGALRYLFQVLKFNRLMHRVWRTEGGYRVEIDGPASLFSKSRKYGLQMAIFLPAVLALEGWAVRAQLDWTKGEHHSFELDPAQGLVSHYKPKGQWVAEEEKRFEKRFVEIAPEGWGLERRGEVHVLEHGEVLVSDYVITYDGREVFVEVVGFWRKAYLERRIEMLRALDGVPLILVVSERLKSDRAKLDDAPAQVIFFKSVINAKTVLATAKAVLGVEE
ncbi:MAG: DUF790 family protein [Myxococcota bacterium]